MKRTLAAALLLAAALAGCSTPPKWTNPNKDSYEYKADLAECERFFGGSEDDTLTCMKQKGWRRTR